VYAAEWSQAEDMPYIEPASMPKGHKSQQCGDFGSHFAGVPSVKELGVTSAPLKSAAFFIGAFCKDYNGKLPPLRQDFTLRIERRGLYALQGREPGPSTLPA
jgi:hypothetical protein